MPQNTPKCKTPASKTKLGWFFDFPQKIWPKILILTLLKCEYKESKSWQTGSFWVEFGLKAEGAPLPYPYYQPLFHSLLLSDLLDSNISTGILML